MDDILEGEVWMVFWINNDGWVVGLFTHLQNSPCRLMENFRSLGCRVSKLGVKRKTGVDEGVVNTTSCSATLQIPLEFPKIKKGRKTR